MNMLRALPLLVSVILLVMINEVPHLAPIIMRLHCYTIGRVTVSGGKSWGGRVRALPCVLPQLQK